MKKTRVSLTVLERWHWFGGEMTSSVSSVKGIIGGALPDDWSMELDSN